MYRSRDVMKSIVVAIVSAAILGYASYVRIDTNAGIGMSLTLLGVISFGALMISLSNIYCECNKR